MKQQDEIYRAALSRIAARYQRRNRSDLWNETTVKEFLRVFALATSDQIMSIVDEMLLAPPTDDRGRPLNWLPDPADFVAILQRHQSASVADTEPADVVAEILEAIDRYGVYGVVNPERPNIRAVGEPPLTELAQKVVRALGGWVRLCTEEQPYGVLHSNLLRIAEQYHQRHVVSTSHHILDQLRIKAITGAKQAIVADIDSE